KMSKSLGNFVLARDVLDEHDPLVVRYALAAAHYRSNLDLSPKSFDEAEAALDRIRTFLERVGRHGDYGRFSYGNEAFAAAMDDDLGVPQALAVVHERVREGNTALDAGDTETARALAGEVATLTGILGLNPLDPQWASGPGSEAPALDALLRELIEQRARARAEKDWAAADRIRDAIAAAGVTLEDGPDGTHWSIA
uniref:DALR domain-containing protein n=1 Tax=Microbacterium sp. TaxID=51671 RepID=UPI003458469C